MSVQEKSFLRSLNIFHSFNTSYVSVQVYYSPLNQDKILFQYILCVGSSKALIDVPKGYALFQYILCVGSRSGGGSGTSGVLEFQYILCVGSSLYNTQVSGDTNKFQYILCVGSRYSSK